MKKIHMLGTIAISGVILSMALLVNTSKAAEESFVLNHEDYPDEKLWKAISLIAGDDNILTIDELGEAKQTLTLDGVVDFTGLDKLSMFQTICITNTSYTEYPLDLSSLSNSNINIENCNISSFVMGSSTVKNLKIVNCTIPQIDCSNASKLFTFECEGNHIQTLILKGCNKLRTLKCSKNELYMLDLSETNVSTFVANNNKAYMNSLSCEGFLLSGMDIGDMEAVSGCSLANGLIIPNSGSNEYSYIYKMKNSSGTEMNATFTIIADTITHSLGSDGICANEDCGRDAVNVKCEGFSMTLAEQIGLDFVLSIPEYVFSDDTAYVSFDVADVAADEPVTKKVLLSSLTKSGDNYIATCYVPAKMMTKKISAKVVTANNEGASYSTTIQGYAEKALENYASDADTVSMIKAMLNYGAYSQKYFGYNSSNLANAILSDTDVVLKKETDFSSFKPYVTDKTTKDSNLKYIGSNISLQSGIVIKHYFAMNDDYDKYQVNEYGTYDPYYIKLYDSYSSVSHVVDESCFALNGTDYFEIIMPMTTPKKIGSAYDLTFFASDSTYDLDIYYSTLSYAYMVAQNAQSPEKLTDLMYALYEYYYAAQYM